ncbi:MAG: sensor histidine kinase [Coprococcus sp.]
MSKTGKMLNKLKKLPFATIGVILIIFFGMFLMIMNITGSNQAQMSVPLRVTFQGEYKIADGEWKPLVKGEHISATKGDVTLKGYFQLETPDCSEVIGRLPNGFSIELYYDHIGAVFYVPGQEPHVSDIENSDFDESLCGKVWNQYCYTGTDTDTIEIVLTNRHRFGNEDAVDNFLSSMYVYSDNEIFKAALEKDGYVERTLGFAGMIVSLVLFGVAIFSSLFRIPNSKTMWLIGLMIFFAGGYFIFSSPNICLWSDMIILNTTAEELCMMLYIFCMMSLITMCLSEKIKKYGRFFVALSGAVTVILIVMDITGYMYIYDTNLIWAITQILVSIILLVCIIGSISRVKRKQIVLLGMSVISLMAFITDIIGTATGWWQGGFISKKVFILLFLIALAVVFMVIPQNIRAALREKKLKAELEESRIAIMMSQIQPHFIYNTLGTIEQLCLEQPETASKLVHDFSLYLRGNFSELNSNELILLSEEMEHVKHYVDIEKVRFPDMEIKFDLHADEFALPALSVQPLVENAIKHGLMGLERGGTVTITSYETNDYYCVSVMDNGVGFDSNDIQDGQNHIGIRNIRGRLKAMCGGTLTVDSIPGKGTTALIEIPKEDKEA